MTGRGSGNLTPVMVLRSGFLLVVLHQSPSGPSASPSPRFTRAYLMRRILSWVSRGLRYAVWAARRSIAAKNAKRAAVGFRAFGVSGTYRPSGMSATMARGELGLV